MDGAGTTDRDRPGGGTRLGACLAVLLVLVGAGQTLAQAKRAAPVGVDAVREEVIDQRFPVIGRMVARRAGAVAARVAGPVAEVRVEVGDRVEAGQILAVLVRERLGAERARRAADVAERAAALTTASAEETMTAHEMARLARLKKSRSAAFPQARHDDMRNRLAMLKSEVAEAKARLARAKAVLRLADIALKYAEIRAPYAGVVTIRHVEIGAWLKVGEPVVDLVDDDTLELEADVPAARIPDLPPGAPVWVLIAGERYAAKARAVVPEENPLTRTRAVRFTPAFETREAGFAANQSVTVEIPIGKGRRAVTVHKDGVIKRGGGSVVFLAVDGKARSRPVELGVAIGIRFEVLSGLAAGDLVVVRGNERLRPGQAIRHEGAGGAKPGATGKAPAGGKADG